MGCGSAKISSSVERKSSVLADSPSMYEEDSIWTRKKQRFKERGPSRKQKNVLTKESRYVLENDFSTVTRISGSSRIRLRLSSDGSVMQIETEKLDCEKSSLPTRTTKYKLNESAEDLLSNVAEEPTYSKHFHKAYVHASGDNAKVIGKYKRTRLYKSLPDIKLACKANSDNPLIFANEPHKLGPTFSEDLDYQTDSICAKASLRENDTGSYNWRLFSPGGDDNDEEISCQSLLHSTSPAERRRLFQVSKQINHDYPVKPDDGECDSFTKHMTMFPCSLPCRQNTDVGATPDSNVCISPPKCVSLDCQNNHIIRGRCPAGYSQYLVENLHKDDTHCMDNSVSHLDSHNATETHITRENVDNNNAENQISSIIERRVIPVKRSLTASTLSSSLRSSSVDSALTRESSLSSETSSMSTASSYGNRSPWSRESDPHAPLLSQQSRSSFSPDSNRYLKWKLLRSKNLILEIDPTNSSTDDDIQAEEDIKVYQLKDEIDDSQSDNKVETIHEDFNKDFEDIYDDEDIA